MFEVEGEGGQIYTDFLVKICLDWFVGMFICFVWVFFWGGGGVFFILGVEHKG